MKNKKSKSPPIIIENSLGGQETSKLKKKFCENKKKGQELFERFEFKGEKWEFINNKITKEEIIQNLIHGRNQIYEATNYLINVVEPKNKSIRNNIIEITKYLRKLDNEIIELGKKYKNIIVGCKKRRK